MDAQTKLLQTLERIEEKLDSLIAVFTEDATTAADAVDTQPLEAGDTQP